MGCQLLTRIFRIHNPEDFVGPDAQDFLMLFRAMGSTVKAEDSFAALRQFCSKARKCVRMASLSRHHVLMKAKRLHNRIHIAKAENQKRGRKRALWAGKQKRKVSGYGMFMKQHIRRSLAIGLRGFHMRGDLHKACMGEGNAAWRSLSKLQKQHYIAMAAVENDELVAADRARVEQFEHQTSSVAPQVGLSDANFPLVEQHVIDSMRRHTHSGEARFVGEKWQLEVG